VQTFGNFLFVGPHSFGIVGELTIPDDCLGDVFDGAVLSEYTQLFWIARAVLRRELMPTTGFLHFFQYRKFLSSKNGERSSKSVPYSSICSPSESAKYFPTQIFLENLLDRRAIMISKPLKLKSTLAENYATHHVTEDFSGFIAALAIQPDFPPERVNRFINCPFLIASPSLAFMDTRMFVDTMQILERVWEAFFKNFYKPRNGYQRRVGGFLIERLHSFLLVEAIVCGKISVYFGQYFTVVEQGDVVPTI